MARSRALLSPLAGILLALYAGPALAEPRHGWDPECLIRFEPDKRGMPRFEQHRTSAPTVGKPAAVRLDNAFARRFRTVLRRKATAGPNFAGHYTLVEVGCGTGCALLAVIDVDTGQVYVDPGLHEIDTNRLAETENEDLIFRRDSALLVVLGWPAEGDQGASYYRWTGKRFERLAAAPIPEGCNPAYDRKRKAVAPERPRPR